MKVYVDARVELASVISLLAPWSRAPERMREYPYLREVYNYFGRWRDHEAVRAFVELMHLGFSVDALLGLATHLSNPPELEIRVDFSNYIVEKARGRGNAEKFVEKLRAFCGVARFMEFYSAHKGFYSKVVKALRSEVEAETVVESLEDFFGTTMDGYHIVPLLTLEGNFGYRLESEGRVDAFAFVMPTGIAEGLPVFEGARVAVEHELIHAFLNPLAERYRDAVNEYLKALGPLKEGLGKYGYGRAVLIFNEHLVRACNIALEELYMGLPKERVARWIKVEEERGFRLIRVFYEAVRRYTAKKAEYRSFENFYLEMLKMLRAR